MSKAIIRQSERVYRFLVKLYPKSYRQEFGEEMQFVFSESLKDAYIENGGQGAIRLWSRTIMDAGKSLVIQYVENLKNLNEGEAMKTIIMQNKNLFLIALATAFILLVPLVAMQFTDEVAWSMFDFAFAGALLFSTGLAFELITRRADTIAYRAAVGAALAAAFLLIWLSGAVGIIGSEDNPANWMYIGVLAVGIIGALIARFRSYGMARTLFAMALAQAMVTVVALMIVKPEVSSGQALLDVVRELALNAFFVALWVGSALLFRRANATLIRQLG